MAIANRVVCEETARQILPTDSPQKPKRKGESGKRKGENRKVKMEREKGRVCEEMRG